MTSRLRVESPTGIYHVTHRGNNKDFIFQNNYVKGKMCEFIKESMENHDVEVYAYCIMNNHLHLLIKAELKKISAFVHDFATCFAGYFNWKYEHVGHVFQGRFGSECIDSERYFWACMRYIHLNPVKAGLVNDMRQYKYSSASEYSTGKRSLLHEKALLLKQNKFETEKSFWSMHENIATYIFSDIEEDQVPYYMEIMETIMSEIKEKYKLESIQIIFDTPKFRNELKKELRERLEMSRRKAETIFENYRQAVSENDPAGFQKRSGAK